MKKIYAAAAIVLVSLGVAACADLGLGVDLDSSGVNPYWYGSGYIGDTYWNTPVWNYGPIYNPRPPRPPLIGGGPGPVIPQPPVQAPRPPQVNVNPGMNGGVPNTVGGIQRPGNGGLPNPSNVQNPPSVPTARPVSNNAARR